MAGLEFNWQAVEEQRENAARDDRPVRAAPRQGRGCGRAILIAALLIALVGGGIYLGILRPVEKTLDDLEKDVLAGHALVQRAAAEFDVALLDTMLPDDDPGWKNTVYALLGQRLIFDRTAFGLTAMPDDTSIEDVFPSPDLKQAEVVSERAYAIDAGRGVTGTIHLQHTFLYRFDGKRWVLSQPGDDFWGKTITTTGELLTLAYPERDAAIGARLARDLDAALVTTCVELYEGRCEANRRVQLMLSGNASNLMRITEPGGIFVTLRGGTQFFSLPAPTLFGAPVDEPGYHALYRIYATHLIENFARDAIGLRRRDSLAWYRQGLRDWLMVRLDLQPWPRAVADDPRMPPPVPFPDQDIAIYCAEGLRRYGSLYRYSPSTDTGAEIFSGRLLPAMAPLAGGEGVLLQEAVTADGRASRLVLWQGGRERILLDAISTPDLVVLNARVVPPGHKLLVTRQSLNIASGQTDYLLINLNRCGAAGMGCESHTLRDAPIWSPDGARTLIFNSREGRLFLGDEDGHSMEDIGDGLNPFWIDGDTYGYFTTTIGRAASLVAVDVTTGELRVVLEVANLMPEESGQLFLGSTFPGRADGDPLLISLITVSPQSERRTYWFQIDPRSGDAQRLSINDDFFGFGHSPDGRWLVGSTFDPVAQALSFHFFDIERGEMQTPVPDNALGPLAGFYARDNWSTDGQWFLSLSDGVLYLIAPEHDYYRTIIPELPGCIFAAWINRK